MEVKEHYKMYKDGKRWVFAAITVAAIGLGTAVGQDAVAHADTTTATAETAQSSEESATPAQSVALTGSPVSDQSTTDGSSTTSGATGSQAGEKSTDGTDGTGSTDDTTPTGDTSGVATGNSESDGSSDGGSVTDGAVSEDPVTGNQTSDAGEDANTTGNGSGNTAEKAGAGSLTDSADPADASSNDNDVVANDKTDGSGTIAPGTDGTDQSTGKPAVAPAAKAFRALSAAVPPVMDTSILTYEVNEDGSVTITGATQDVGETLVIPSTITDNAGNVLTVTGIGQGFNSVYGNTQNLQTLIIENGITSIADNAFSYLNTLKTVDLSQNKTLTSIGSQAFAADGLTSLVLPDSVTTIGDQAFASNPLTSVTFSRNLQTLGASAFIYDPLTAIDLGNSTGLTAINDLTFFGSQASSLILPPNLTTIGSQAFASNANLTSVTIPASVTSIEDQAFLQNSHLATLTFAPGSQLQSIGDGTFTYDGLTSVSLPASLLSIGDSAFAANSALTELNFAADGQLAVIGAHAFENDNGLTTLMLPASLTTLGDFAFSTIHGLTSVIFANGSQPLTMGNSAFIYDTALTSVTLPANLASIGSQAFLSATSLSEITFPAGLMSIGDNAFTYDQALTTIDLTGATSLTSIGNGAFEYSGLTGNLTLPTNLTTIGNLAFAANNLTGVVLNDNLQSIGTSAFIYNALKGSVLLPATLTAVGDTAFYGNQLTTVNVPATVSQIGNNVFSYNRINHLTTSNATTNLALNQNAYYFADQPTVSLADLFNVSLGGVTLTPQNVSDLSDGVTLNSDGTFTVPAGVDQFTFNWSVPTAATTYTGQYQVVLNNPDIKVFNSTIFYGDSWTPADNLVSAVKPDGSEATIADLTVTVTNVATGKPVATNAVTSQAGTYRVTYSYGANSAVALVTVAKRTATYTIKGSSTVTYNGQTPTLDLSQYSANLSISLPYTLKDGDLTLAYTDANGKQVLMTADNASQFVNAGTYEVVVNPAAWERLNAETPALANFDWSGSGSVATLTIAPAAVTVTVPDQTMYYGEQEPTPSLTIVDQDGNPVTGTDLTVTRDAGNTVGTYAYHLSQLGANYTLAGDSTIGSLTIQKQPLNIVVGSQTVAAGQPDPAVDLQVTDRLGNPVANLGLVVTREPGTVAGTYAYLLDDSQLNANYEVGSATVGALTITAVPETLAGSDYTMTVGDATPTAADFKATATDSNGQLVDSGQIQLDFGTADLTQPGKYLVTLRYGDAPAVTVTLTVVAKTTGGGNGDGGNTGGGTDPVDPTDPTDPTDPVDPVDPTDPVDPSQPTDPDSGNHHEVISDGGVGAKVKPGIDVTVSDASQLPRQLVTRGAGARIQAAGQSQTPRATTVPVTADHGQLNRHDQAAVTTKTAKEKAATTLPQTSEAATSGWSILGLILGGLGLLGYRKRRHN